MFSRSRPFFDESRAPEIVPHSTAFDQSSLVNATVHCYSRMAIQTSV